MRNYTNSLEFSVLISITAHTVLLSLGCIKSSLHYEHAWIPAYNILQVHVHCTMYIVRYICTKQVGCQAPQFSPTVLIFTLQKKKRY